MPPTLPPGSILQNRYQIVKVLCSDSFCRTYLAEDKDRFGELGVLKEYNPNVEGTDLEYRRQLFEREAKTLYKIEHPQIPKFRATFEQGKRLFLVQDYVEGQTYRTLLDLRLANNRKYTQREIVQFFEQMLPVLEHIHSKGIIHRDLSPDNIIYSKITIEGKSKRLPVLIDFGAVKEIGTTNLQSSEGSVRGTTVGKLGYSPPEQLQTGEVSPSSDLYALTVTAVVLMTGRKPEELLNEQTMMPCWHQWVPDLHPRFAPILNRMMSYRPENRYQSANDALFDLRSNKQLILGPKERPAAPKPNSNKPVRTSKSTAKVATAPQSKQNQPPRKKASPSLLKTLWQNPWTGKLIGGSLVFLITAGVSLSLRPSVKEVSRRPISPSPEEPDPSPIQPGTDANNLTMEIPLNLSSGDIKNEAGTIQSDEIYRYRISGSPGKLLSIKLRKGRVAMTVLNSNEEAIVEKIPTEWQGKIPDDGVYSIDIHPLAGSQNSEYELEIAVMES